jgi:hypothetical protein
MLTAVKKATKVPEPAVEEPREEPNEEGKDGFQWPFGVGEEEETQDVVIQTAPVTEPVEEVAPTEEPPETTQPTEEIISDFDTFPMQVLRPDYGYGEITASVLNVREHPGEGYEIIRGLERGSRVNVEGLILVDGVYWGAIYDGWICMDYVAMDGDVVGSWYQELSSDPATGEQRYGFWTFDFSGEFRFVIYRFAGEQVRQESRSGGEFRMDETRIALRFTYGKEEVTIGGITTAVPGDITLNWNVLGKMMTLQDAQRTTLTRGTVDKLKKQLTAE